MYIQSDANNCDAYNINLVDHVIQRGKMLDLHVFIQNVYTGSLHITREI